MPASAADWSVAKLCVSVTPTLVMPVMGQQPIATGETKDITLCVPGESETLDMLTQLMQDAGREFEG